VWAPGPSVAAALAVALAIFGTSAAEPASGRDAPTNTGSAPPVILAAPAAITDPLVLNITVVTPRTVGSAFPLDRGVLATAAHLVPGLAPGDSVVVRSGGPGGPMAEAMLLAVSRELDLALLRPPHDLPLSPPPPDAGVTAYAAVVAAGSVPARDPAIVAHPRRISGATTGETLRIAGVGHGLIAHLPGVTQGFSGGPVLDERGGLVGMIVAIRRHPASGSAFAPNQLRSAQTEAFVLPAALIRREAGRLLVQRSAGAP
jgi:S1-C subfamily serine protease